MREWSVDRSDFGGLANQVSVLWRSDWGWGWGYGEGARDWKKWWWDWCSRKILSALTVFYMVLLLSSPLGQNMGGGHDRWNNGDELFTCSAAGQCLGTQAVIHKLSGRHITDRLNSRPVFEANLSANESWALGRGELALWCSWDHVVHMCVSLLLSDVDRRLNREIGGDGVLSHTTHLGLHDNSCFETLLWEEGKLERLSRPRVVGWLPASEQWCGRGAAGSRNSSVNNPSATWGGAILYFWNKCSVFVP